MLMQGEDSTKKNSAFAKMMAKKGAINLNMLGVLMEDIVMSHLKSTITVTIQSCQCR